MKIPRNPHELQGQWPKVLALAMVKFAIPEFTLSAPDLQAAIGTLHGLTLVATPTQVGTGLRVRLLTEEDARRLEA